MENFYLFDWVSFTTKKHNPNEIQKLLGMDYISWEKINGAQGYKDREYFDKISIHYNGNYDSVWCEMSGQGCRAFETYGNGDYNALFKALTKNEDEFNVTRLDIAFDDHTGLLNITNLLADTISENFVSRSGEYMYTGGSRGISIQHGRKSSNTLIRIYDKAAEQRKQEHWIRTEIQLRKENAYNFILRYLEDNNSISDTFLGVVNNYLRYIEPSSDSNRWRHPMTPYWENFINGASKIKLYKKPGVEYNMGNLENFVIKQAGQATMTYLKIMGEQAYKQNIVERYPELNDKYKRLVEKHGTAAQWEHYRKNKKEIKYAKEEREAIQNEEEQSEMYPDFR